MPNIFTAAQRRSLDRISGDYLHFLEKESDFTISDAISLGNLLNIAIQEKERNKVLIEYYKSAFSIVCGALKFKNPELFLIRISNADKEESWNDFSDFKSVWYPKWFHNQIDLRQNIIQFTSEKTQKLHPDFWGETCPDEKVKEKLLAVRDSFKQLHVGVLAVIFKIDQSIAALFDWKCDAHVSWNELLEKYHYPKYNHINK